MKSVSSYFLAILSISVLASCSSHTRLTRSITSTLSDSITFKQGFTGFALYDPQDDKMLYAYNADKYFTPASNTKLLTFYTGLKILGDSVPALKYHISGDSLIFRGTGDPSLLNPDLPASEILDFLRYRRECLYYAPPQYTEKAFGPGWSWDDYDSYYTVERAAYPIYANRVSFSQSGNKTVPNAYPEQFQKKMQLDTFPLKRTKRINRKRNENAFTYQLFPRDTSFRQEVPIIYSPKLFVKLLADTLKKEIKLKHPVEPAKVVERTLYSIPTDSLYKRMLTVSDNFLAEQVLLLASGVLTDTLKSQIAIDYMKKHYLQNLPDSLQWVDGSGLSRYNLQTPRNMIALLRKIILLKPIEALKKLLPAGGKSGTLKDYYKAETPYIYAKTGSLSNNHSLSGFLVTKSGKTLLFSFMNNNYTVSSDFLKEGMERVLILVRDYY